jgi:N-acetylmuramoyl-L-alanine amidase
MKRAGMTRLEIEDRLSPNHDLRGDPPRIDMLVLHYTGMTSADAALERLCDPAARVSAHYIVEEDGRIWRLVPEHRCAFHAGRSCWEGEPNLNAVSIGIEIVNPGHEWGYRQFPEAQMASVEQLCREVIARHPIPPHRVVGHSDIAPDRKSDPGELFDWPRLARAGIGIWATAAASPPAGEVDHSRALQDLLAIGYCATRASQTAALIAFQRRFRPDRYDGRLDLETAARLDEVRAAFDRSRAIHTSALRTLSNARK